MSKTGALRNQKAQGVENADSEQERWIAFAKALDQIRKRVEGDIGEADSQYIDEIRKLSRRMEIAGRGLIHFSIEPVSFFLGVVALFIHQQLETAEIGHMALHGAYERFGPTRSIQAKNFKWKFPVDEESWRHAHNSRHHTFTNQAGGDPDIHFGFVRLTEETPHRWVHYFQLPVFMFFILPNFGAAINTHVTGLLDVYLGNGLPNRYDIIPDRRWPSIFEAHKKAFRKWIPYCTENYVFYPVLAGPFFWKVILGNWMAGVMRDTYTGLAIVCGHVGSGIKSYPTASDSSRRGQWYVMQAEAAGNFEVPRPLSILCGALDRQIEHHLFPRLPPNRLREVSAEVRACCEAYGVHYQSTTWPKAIVRSLARVGSLSFRAADKS